MNSIVSGASLASAIATAEALPPSSVATTDIGIAVDPIFEMIKEHHHLYNEWDRIGTEFDKAEGKVSHTIERRPSTLIAWRNYSAIGGHEIDEMRDRLLAEPRANRKKVEREYRQAKKRERLAIEAERQWYERHDLARSKDSYKRIIEVESQAREALAKVQPTTPAGAAELIACVCRDMEVGYSDWQLEALTNATRALRVM